MEREFDLFPIPVSQDVVAPGDYLAAQSPLRPVWGVSRLLSEIAYRLDAGFSAVWVEGEVSGIRNPSSGHVYFILKDETSQIRAVMFRTSASRVPFALEEGMKILCLARVNVYTARGDLQLVVDAVERTGEGVLGRALEELKERLFREGLFDAGRKRPLPLVPRRVFVLTSPTGAAVRDFVRTSRARFPAAQMVLVPVRVQGEGAAGEMILALDAVRSLAGPDDVVVITRGGGSLEDLREYNDEGLARAIYAFPCPVVSAVGHEIDFTIADFVADHRASTPTAAAQLVFPERAVLKERLGALCRHAESAIRNRTARASSLLQTLRYRLRDPARRLVEARLRQDELASRMAFAVRDLRLRRMRELDVLAHALRDRDPRRRLELFRATLQGLSGRLFRAPRSVIDRMRALLSQRVERLDALSPLKVLGRGYCIVTGPTGRIVRSFRDVRSGDLLKVRPVEGVISCRVVEAWEGREEQETGKG
ncbi:MAG: exodeoxyribonuclease VII large subunit [Deltaproteobacteria bacterium]